MHLVKIYFDGEIVPKDNEKVILMVKSAKLEFKRTLSSSSSKRRTSP